MGANTDASELVQMEAAAPDMASVLIDRLAAKEQARKAEVEKRRCVRMVCPLNFARSMQQTCNIILLYLFLH